MKNQYEIEPFIKDVCMFGTMEGIITLKNRAPKLYREPSTQERLVAKAKKFADPDFNREGLWKSDDEKEQEHQLDCLNGILMFRNISEENRDILISWMISEMLK